MALALDETFWPALWSLATSVGTRPETLLAVWNAESGLDPKAQNKNGCVGLNQTCPKPYGPGFPSDDAEAFKSASASEQLVWIAPQVLSGYHLNRGPFLSAARYYQANFLPATLPTVRGAREVLAAERGPYAQAYDQNRVLDVGGDGAITLSDLGRFVELRAQSSDTLSLAIAKAYVERPDYAPWLSPNLVFFEPDDEGRGGGGRVFLAVLTALFGVGLALRRG